MKDKICFQLQDTAWPIELGQQARNRFSVRYGLQKKEALTYAAACADVWAEAV